MSVRNYGRHDLAEQLVVADEEEADEHDGERPDDEIADPGCHSAYDGAHLRRIQLFLEK